MGKCRAQIQSMGHHTWPRHKKKERLEEELVQRDCVRGIRDQRQREFRKEITPTLPLTHLFGRDPKQLSYVCEREHVLSTSC